MEALEKEIGKLSTGHNKLEKKKSYLQAVAGDRAAETEQLNIEQELLRQHLEQLSGALSKADDEANSVKLVSNS
jgi:hypothetical protein